MIKTDRKRKIKIQVRVLAGILILAILSAMPSYQIIAEEISRPSDSDDITLGEAGGYLEGFLSTTKSIYSERNFTYSNGHGFAAERANNLQDRLQGKISTIVGGDNVKNGPDRKIVNKDGSVTWIQDKYCQTASKSISNAFDSSTSLYRYLDADGNPMVLEVPSDQYDDVVQLFAKKIEEGKVPGVTDPAEAYNLVQKGKYTYQQAVNLTKAGNIDSLKYDATNGAITAACSMGISFVLDYVSCIINGEDAVEALKESGLNAIKTGGFVFATYVISSQLAKTGLTAALAPATDAVAASLGTGVSKAILNAFGTKGAMLTVKKISSILQSQIIVEGVMIVALTIPDIIDLFRGRISSKQLLKNLTVAVITSAGGFGGAVGGAALGTLISPGVGSAVGAIIGGAIAAFGAGALSEWAISKFLEDDSEEMYNIIQGEFQELSEEYLLTQSEADNVVVKLQDLLDGDTLKDMYASDDRTAFARKLMEPVFDEEVSLRATIVVPTEEEVRCSLLEDLNGIVFLH